MTKLIREVLKILPPGYTLRLGMHNKVLTPGGKVAAVFPNSPRADVNCVCNRVRQDLKRNGHYD